MRYWHCFGLDTCFSAFDWHQHIYFWATGGGWGGGGGGGGGEVRWGDLSILTWEIQLETKIQWKEFGLLLFKYCLKTGLTFRWKCQLNMSVRWSIPIEKIGSAYIYIHISYKSYTYHIHITLVVPSRQCLFTYLYLIYINTTLGMANVLMLFQGRDTLPCSQRECSWSKYEMNPVTYFCFKRRISKSCGFQSF